MVGNRLLMGRKESNQTKNKKNNIGTDLALYESCYKKTIFFYFRNYITVTIPWSFSYNSIVKIYGSHMTVGSAVAQW